MVTKEKSLQYVVDEQLALLTNKSLLDKELLGTIDLIRKLNNQLISSELELNILNGIAIKLEQENAKLKKHQKH